MKIMRSTNVYKTRNVMTTENNTHEKYSMPKQQRGIFATLAMEHNKNKFRNYHRLTIILSGKKIRQPS